MEVVAIKGNSHRGRCRTGGRAGRGTKMQSCGVEIVYHVAYVVPQVKINVVGHGTTGNLMFDALCTLLPADNHVNIIAVGQKIEITACLLQISPLLPRGFRTTSNS